MRMAAMLVVNMAGLIMGLVIVLMMRVVAVDVSDAGMSSRM